MCRTSGGTLVGRGIIDPPSRMPVNKIQRLITPTHAWLCTVTPGPAYRNKHMHAHTHTGTRAKHTGRLRQRHSTHTRTNLSNLDNELAYSSSSSSSPSSSSCSSSLLSTLSQRMTLLKQPGVSSCVLSLYSPSRSSKAQ